MPECPRPQSSIHEITCADLVGRPLLRRETGDEYAIGERFIYRRNQINIHAPLRYVAQSSRCKSSRKDVRVLMNGEKYDLGIIAAPLAFLRDLDSVHAWHRDGQDNKVR